MAFHGTCPVCGHSSYKQKNPLNELRSLYGQRSKKAQRVLAKVSELIKDNIPSDAKTDAKLKFMYKVSKVEDISFMRGCEQYIRSTHWQQGKGWNYLAAIINNVGANSTAVAKNEKRRIGTAPKKKEIK